MHLDITFRRAPEFEQDLAHYGVLPATVARVEASLRADPLRGAPLPADPRVRLWEVGEMRVTYLLLAAEERIWLVRITPREEPKPRVLERVQQGVRLVNDLKRLLLNW